MDGWVTMTPPAGLGGLHVRMRPDDDGRLVVEDMYIHGGPVTAAHLRVISVPRIEAYLNRDPWIGGPGALLDDSETTVADLRARAKEEPPAKPRKDLRRTPLTRPDGRNTDAFYLRVADAYNDHVQTNRAPAKGMAEEAGVPVTTVHRWVREARRRGFLAPGRKGIRG